jgi:acetyltransferase-like isoleucine patch superfamily enzyme
MKRKLRLLGLMLTALLPGFLKRPIYRIVFGFQIGNHVRIGIAILDCARLTIADHVSISHGVVFIGCGDVRIGNHVIIGVLNLFRGGELIALDDYSHVIRQNIINAIPDNDAVNRPESIFLLGYGSVVTAEHRIDFTDRVSIGECSIFGGRNSSIWTHNRRIGKPVEIGNYCYLGSEIRMAPGAKIPDCCIVGLGSVVTQRIEESDSLISGFPAKRVRALSKKDYELIFAKTRKDLPDRVYPTPPDATGVQINRQKFEENVSEAAKEDNNEIGFLDVE